mmetsp:Transcript_16631/g.50378  ORF Transcript_16631/g.50378 Transcript_16631/m.50378 type:complete len:108 (+) Transcript_16631:629-952(+)
MHRTQLGLDPDFPEANDDDPEDDDGEPQPEDFERLLPTDAGVETVRDGDAARLVARVFMADDHNADATDDACSDGAFRPSFDDGLLLDVPPLDSWADEIPDFSAQLA